MRKLLMMLGIYLATLGMAAAQTPTRPNPDEAAIRNAVQSYIEAFNRGDAAAVAGHWSNEGEYVSPAGEKFKGRKKIEEAFKGLFEQNKGLHVQVTPDLIRLESPNRALESGTAIVTRPGQAPEETRYLARHVKRGSEWKLTSVTEEEVPKNSASYEHLKDLEWLIGDWIDADETGKVETTYQWAKDKSFITASFTVNLQGGHDLQGTQVIGWDPVKKSIKSWVFDSDGGFGEGAWIRQGNQWRVSTASVLPTGEKASSLNIFTSVDNNTFTFQSTGREVGGALLPNIREVAVVRKQSARQSAGTAGKRGGQ